MSLRPFFVAGDEADQAWPVSLASKAGSIPSVRQVARHRPSASVPKRFWGGPLQHTTRDGASRRRVAPRPSRHSLARSTSVPAPCPRQSRGGSQARPTSNTARRPRSSHRHASQPNAARSRARARPGRRGGPADRARRQDRYRRPRAVRESVARDERGRPRCRRRRPRRAGTSRSPRGRNWDRTSRASPAAAGPTGIALHSHHEARQGRAKREQQSCRSTHGWHVRTAQKNLAPP